MIYTWLQHKAEVTLQKLARDALCVTPRYTDTTAAGRLVTNARGVINSRRDEISGDEEGNTSVDNRLILLCSSPVSRTLLTF